MLSAFTAEEGFLFALALTLMLLILLVEILSLVLGGGVSAALEGLLPEDSGGAASDLLGWLRVRQVPMLMLLAIFLTAFGLMGLFAQAFFHQTFGRYLPGWLLALPVFLLTLPVVRVGGGVLSKWMPRDESTAVSEDSFVGYVAVITLGTAQSGHPAEAKLRDVHGQTHYLLVEPDAETESFPAGTEVIITERRGAFYRGIRNYNPNLKN